MTDEQQTVLHLRELIAALQIKLDARTRILASILPHLETAFASHDDVDNFVVHEFFERHDVDVKNFKEEYGREFSLAKVSGQHIVPDGKSST